LGQVHKSYYLSKMPASIRDRKVIKPLSYFGFSEIKQQADEMELNNLLTFADAHGEVEMLSSKVPIEIRDRQLFYLC
jgi:hypothetical protein